MSVKPHKSELPALPVVHRPGSYLNVPNGLTCTRVLLIPVLVACFYAPGLWRTWGAACVFGVACCTDGLDGFLARRWGQRTPLGAFLDPVADKLMVAVALVLLVGRSCGPALALPAAVVVGREIAVSALREWMADVGERALVAVGPWGKIKTAVQMVAITWLLAAGQSGVMHVMGVVLLDAAAALTLWSMWIYWQAAQPSLWGR